MTFWDRVKGLFGVTTGTPGAGQWQYAHEWVRGMDVPGQNSSELTMPYAQHPVIGAALNVIAQDAASVPLNLHAVTERGEVSDDPLDAHWVYDLLNNPQQDLTRHQLFVVSHLHYLLHGEWFWDLEGISAPNARASRAVQEMALRGGLGVLYPERVLSETGDDGVVRWAYDEGEGRQRPLDPDKLFSHKRVNPYALHRGLSPLAALQTELRGDHAASEWNARFFGEQNGFPTGMLKPPQGAGSGGQLSMTKDQRDEFLRAWNQKHARVKRTIGMLPPGWDFESMATSQHDMDFRALREYAREIALSVLGVPPFMAGVLDKANYANARKQEEVYWQGTIKRYLSAVQDALNNHLLPKLGVTGVAFYYDWESVQALVEDYDAKLSAADKLFKMGVPLSVINDRLSLGIDVDEIDQADVPFLPANMMSADRVANPPDPPPMPSASTESESDESDEGAEDDEEKRLKEMEAHDRAVRDTLHWKRLDRQQLDLAKRFEKTVRSHFEDLRKEAEQSLERGVRALKIQQAIRKQDGDGVDVPPNVFGIIDWEDADERVARVTEAQYKQAATRGGESVIVELGLTGSFNVQNPRVQAALLAREQAIKGVNETTRKELLEAFEKLVSREGGTTMDELRKAAEEVFQNRKNNARTIARTEVGSAYSTGRFEQMREAGVKKKRWLSSQDADVRASHRAMNGQTADINGVFSNGLEYPKEPGGPASEVINCRCEAVAVVEDD